jgi:hypothetical protein
MKFAESVAILIQSKLLWIGYQDIWSRREEGMDLHFRT